MASSLDASSSACSTLKVTPRYDLPSREDQVQAILKSKAPICEKRIAIIGFIQKENVCRNGPRTNPAFDVRVTEINTLFTNLEGGNCLSAHSCRRQLFPRGALTDGDPNKLPHEHTLTGQYDRLQRLITSDIGIKQFGCPDYLIEALEMLARQTYLKCLAEIVVEASNILSEPHIHAKVSYLTYLEIDRLHACIDAANEEIDLCGCNPENLTSGNVDLLTKEDSFSRWQQILRLQRNKYNFFKYHGRQLKARTDLHVMLGLEEPPRVITQGYFAQLAAEMAKPVRSKGGLVDSTASLDVR